MSTPITNDTFQHEVVNRPGTVLVEFFTDGCGPCRMMSPVLDEISRERTDIKVVKIDAAANHELASEFHVAAVPTFVLFTDGQPKAQFTGARSKKDLLMWIDSISKSH